MALALLSSLPFMAIGYLAMPTALSAQSPEVITAARWYLLLVPILALTAMPSHPLRGSSDFVAWNGLRITPAIGWLGILIMAWLLGRTQPEFLAASYLGVLALLFFPVIYILAHRIPGPFWPELRKWKPMLRYGLPSMASSLPQILNLRLGQMLMATFLPAQMLGLYVVAVGWSGATQPMLKSLGAVLFPRIASEVGREQQVEALAEGTRLGVLLALSFGLALLVLTPFGIPFLFGEAFAAATPVAMVLVVAAAIAGLNLVMEEGLRGIGVPTSIMWAEFGGLIVTAISLLFLLGSLEMMGAALASLIGSCAVAVLLTMQVWWVTALSPVDFLCPAFGGIRSGWTRVGTKVTCTRRSV
jgi:O-antigen/teichoic acid export membrane protein